MREYVRLSRNQKRSRPHREQDVPSSVSASAAEPEVADGSETVTARDSSGGHNFSQVRVFPDSVLQGAQKKAESEPVFQISSAAQTAIDSQSSGEFLEESTRTYMEASLGADFRDVRVHRGVDVDVLTHALGANAFTQGNDVFLSSARDQRTEQGLETLAHELGHVAQGQTAAGYVQRDAAAAPAPAAVAAEPTYSLTLTDGEHANLSKAEALKLLSDVHGQLSRSVDLYRGEWAEINKSRTTFFGAVGGALTDLAGQAFPTYDKLWAALDNAVDASRAALRSQDVQGAANKLKETDAEYRKAMDTWGSYKNQIDSAGTKAQIGVGVAAVVAVAVIATGGAIAAPAAAAGGGGAGAGGAVVGGGVGGAAALGATAPVDVAAAGTATTVAAGGGGAAAGGVVVGGGAGGSAAVATTVAADAAAASTGTGAAAATGTATAAGVGGATADGIVTATIQDTTAALASGGPAAAAEFAAAQSVGILEAAYARLAVILVANAPFTSRELQIMKQVADIIFKVWHDRQGFPGDH